MKLCSHCHSNINYLSTNNNFNLLTIATAKYNIKIQYIKNFIHKTDLKFKNKTQVLTTLGLTIKQINEIKQNINK